MKPLRVCFFNRSYHPDLGATGQLLTELAEDLVREHGFQVTVVTGPALRTPREAGQRRARLPFRREWRNGVEILRAWGTTLPPHRFAARALNYLTYFASACLAGLRVRRPDLVVFLTDPPIIGLAALLAARWHRARLVFWCQDIFPEVGRLLEDFRSAVVDRSLDRLGRFLVARAHRVVAVGETMRRRLVEEKGAEAGKVVVIHNWADCAAIVPGPKRNPVSTALGLADSWVVMHAGNVGLAQDLDTLLGAAERLRPYQGIVVAVVGHGTRRAALEARARSLGLDNVRFLPYQPREALADTLAGADAFVVSLRAGLAGYVVPSRFYRMLAAGRPCVVAVDEGAEAAAITAKYDSGLLAGPGDADALARSLLALHRDADLRERLGANARLAAADFDRPAQVGAHAALLREVAEASRAGAPRPAPALKRPFDIVLSAAGLILSAPLWLLIGALVRLEDGGPVFYGQERVGRAGRRFRSWKFRTMVEDADARFGPLQAREGDPRVTRVGRLLRATALDELPQLWNILRGDMSFVGPRALLPQEIEVGATGQPIPLERIPGYEARHRVRPGLTGLAQVHAPRDLPRRHKFRLDRLYIERQSLWLDLRLIGLSFWITARGRWEHRGRKI
jgi:lipopolysaccharide/colanic/teichoic acid biosynthesis glycosyltransferase